jgi:2-iminoacetate synthase
VHPVSDQLLKSFIVMLRKEFPQSNIVLTTRESFALRLECIELGVNRISLEASTQPGGYTKNKIKADSNQIQFPVKENREIAQALVQMKEYSLSGLEK